MDLPEPAALTEQERAHMLAMIRRGQGRNSLVSAEDVVEHIDQSAELRRGWRDMWIENPKLAPVGWHNPDA